MVKTHCGFHRSGKSNDRPKRNKKHAEMGSVSRDFPHGNSSRRCSRAGASGQPTGEGRLQICGWQNDFGALLQSAHAGTQDFRRSRSIRRGVASGSGRCDVVRAECRRGRRREVRSCGQIYIIHPTNAEQMDFDHQQDDRGVGDSLPRRESRFHAGRNDCIQAAWAAGKFHDFVRSSWLRLHNEAGLGNNSGVDRNCREKINILYVVPASSVAGLGSTATPGGAGFAAVRGIRAISL